MEVWELILSLANVEISLFDNSLTNKWVSLSWHFFKYPVSSQLVSIRLIFTIIMDFIIPEIDVRVFQFIYYRMQKSLFRKSVLIIPEMGEVNIMQKCL